MNEPRARFSDRLRRATRRPMSEDSRASHLASIESALQAQAVPAQPVVRARRRLSVIAVTAALVILPTGIAFAAESSLPGDALYPIKKVTETVRSWVDDEVVAEHRIDELERLVLSDAPADVIADQVDRATQEVDLLSSDHELRPRFDSATAAATDRVTDEAEPKPEEAVADPPSDEPAVTTTTTTVTDTTTLTTTPPDRNTTATTAITDGTTVTTVRPPDVEGQRVFGYVHAGPTCPVERFPPDPECEDFPVAGAMLVISTGDVERGVVESNDEGRFQVRLPNGTYLLTPRPYDGLLGTAPPQEFVVEGQPVELDVAYDTGIR